MDKSIFSERNSQPDDHQLKSQLETTYHLWKSLVEYTYNKYPKAIAEWNFPGEKYGWNFRIKDKKRAIIYLLPREHYFMVAFVFGQKATDAVLESSVSPSIKTELKSAKVYAEGRGIRVKICDGSVIQDIKELIDIKLMY